MSEEPINRKDDVEQDVRDTADEVEERNKEEVSSLKSYPKTDKKITTF